MKFACSVHLPVANELAYYIAGHSMEYNLKWVVWSSFWNQFG